MIKTPITSVQGLAGGPALLGADGKVPLANLPAISTRNLIDRETIQQVGGRTFIKAPNGNYFELVVDNSGTLSTGSSLGQSIPP